MQPECKLFIQLYLNQIVIILGWNKKNPPKTCSQADKYHRILGMLGFILLN